MQDNNQQERPRRRNKTTSLKPIFILLILLIVTAGLSVFFISDPGNNLEPLETETVLPPDVVESSARPQIEDKDVESDQEKNSILVSEDGATISSESAIETQEEKKTRECRVLAGQVNSFFSHVDNEDYMKQVELSEPSQQYFITLTNKLLKNPPVVSRESDDLYTILKNMAHFFRVIGKDNIILIKTILDRERDKIEDVAAELYQWTSWNTCKDDLLQFSPSLDEMYEYAGFFLNTMGGRSYLFRRDSRSRLLVNYYSVLLIERANQEGINRHGIDITKVIPQLVQEIDSSNQLIYKENYIDSLYTLLEKYE